MFPYLASFLVRVEKYFTARPSVSSELGLDLPTLFLSRPVLKRMYLYRKSLLSQLTPPLSPVFAVLEVFFGGLHLADGVVVDAAEPAVAAKHPP